MYCVSISIYYNYYEGCVRTRTVHDTITHRPSLKGEQLSHYRVVCCCFFVCVFFFSCP